MLEKNAKNLRNWFLILSLLVFAVGVIDVFMLGFDLSLGTGLMTRMGFSPHSFLGGAAFLSLLSIAFGLVQLDQSKH